MTDSGYTPTTELVRDLWRDQFYEGIASDEAMGDADWEDERMLAQFDRWLATHDAQVDIDTAHAVALEREAIARFLETPELSDPYWDDPDGIGTDHALAAAIRDGAHNQPTEGEA